MAVLIDEKPLKIELFTELLDVNFSRNLYCSSSSSICGVAGSKHVKETQKVSKIDLGIHTAPAAARQLAAPFSAFKNNMKIDHDLPLPWPPLTQDSLVFCQCPP